MIINLTSEQSKAMELMLDFATSETEERMFLLEGYAELQIINVVEFLRALH